MPEVAAAPPALSPDRRTYTFRIRTGYRFSPPSGAPLTAETFRATLERTLSPRLGKASIAMSVLGDVDGAADYHAGRARHVRGLAASGDRLTIRLMRPAGDLPARLAMPLFCPVPTGTPAVPGGTPKPLPSAGPYYVASQDPGRTVLERNPNYRGERPRRPDRIVYLTGVGADEALQRADKGEVDYVPYDYDHHGPLAVGGPRDRAFGATSPAARRGDQRFFANPAPGLDMLALNPRRPLFRDLAMRRAVNVALDRPALAAVWGELPTDRYVPPAILPATGRSRYPLSGPDVAAARRLAAGRRGTATLYYCGEAGNQRVAEIVRANLRPIGIRVRITPSLACLRGHDPKRDAADIALVSPSTLALDAAGFLALAGGDDEKFGGEVLPRGWGRDDAFLRRLARADALPGAERDAAFAALQEEALEKDAPLAAFSSFVRPEYVAPRIGCRVLQGAYQFLDLGAACVRAGLAERPGEAGLRRRGGQAAGPRAAVDQQQRRLRPAGQRAPDRAEAAAPPGRRQTEHERVRAVRGGDQRIGPGLDEQRLGVDADGALDRDRRGREQPGGVGRLGRVGAAQREQPQRLAGRRGEPRAELDRRPVVLAAAEPDEDGAACRARAARRTAARRRPASARAARRARRGSGSCGSSASASATTSSTS